MRRKPPKFRQCGTCTACCQGTGLAAPAVNKDRWVRCDRLRDEPRADHTQPICTVYPERPDGCRAFECLWLQGLVGAPYRPDRCGLMLTVTAERDVFVADGDAVRQAVIAYEVWPGAADRGDGFQMIRELAKRVLVVLRRQDGIVLSGPPAMVAQAQRALLIKKVDGPDADPC